MTTKMVIDILVVWAVVGFPAALWMGKVIGKVSKDEPS